MSLKCGGVDGSVERAPVDAVYDEANCFFFSVVDFYTFFLYKMSCATPKFLEKSSRDYKVKNIFISLCGVSLSTCSPS